MRAPPCSTLRNVVHYPQYKRSSPVVESTPSPHLLHSCSPSCSPPPSPSPVSAQGSHPNRNHFLQAAADDSVERCSQRGTPPCPTSSLLTQPLPGPLYPAAACVALRETFPTLLLTTYYYYLLLLTAYCLVLTPYYLLGETFPTLLDG